MHKQNMTGFQKHVQEMELALAKIEQGEEAQSHLQTARDQLARAIAIACEMPDGSEKKSLSDLIDSAARHQKGRRESAILILRTLAVEGLLPFEEHQIERRVVALVEDGFGDQLRGMSLSDKRQTYEKINALKAFHESVCSNLRVLKELPPTLAEIDSAKEDILRAINKAITNAYLQPYDWTTLKVKISHICEKIADLEACRDATYKTQFDHLTEVCRDLRHITDQSPCFFNRKYIAPFITTVDEALRALHRCAADQFNCSIDARRKAPHLAEKRYPLHQQGKLLTITIPLVNSGPGMAVDVTAEFDCGNNSALLLESETIQLGDIPPGEFAVSFNARVEKPAELIDMAMQLNWNQLFGAAQSIAVDVRLIAQDPAVDWASLEQLDPYSLSG